jgi:predicted AAA+ superfamily ATPase
VTTSGLLQRHALAQLELCVTSFRVVVVQGPRQAGKTTLLRLFRTEQGGSMRTLDDDTTLSVAQTDPRGFAEFGAQPRMIDEIQRGGDALIRAIKYVVDQSNSRGQYVLSGSTRFLTVPTLSESLAGRAVFVELWPFSVAERVGAAADFGDRLFDTVASVADLGGSRWTRSDYLDVITSGGFPEVVELPSGVARRLWFEAYLQTVIERDVRSFAEIHHAAVVPRMLGLLAARSGSTVVTADIARSVQLSQQTVKSYLTYLETVFLTSTCVPYSSNLTSRLAKTPKIYLTDSGLATYLAGVDAATLASPGHAALGGLVETFVFTELTRLLAASNDRGISLMYLRDRDGREVDFVLEARDGRVAGVEVKAAQTVTAADVRHLAWLRDGLGERFVAGLVFYLGAETVPFGDRLFAVPLSALWGHAGLPR